MKPPMHADARRFEQQQSLELRRCCHRRASALIGGFMLFLFLLAIGGSLSG
jgi:hypothetical protein